jgi:hypothetical protein
MSGPTVSILLIIWCCGGGHLHEEFSEKSNTMSTPTCCNGYLVDGEEINPSKYRGCRHANEKVRKSRWERPRLNRQDVLFQIHHPRTILRGGAT